MKRITARDAIKLDDAVIIDVREDSEYATEHVPGSLSIPMSTLAERMDQVPVDTPLYILCRSGNRSGKVAEYLTQQGMDASNVEGGILEWAEHGGPVASGQPTD